MNQTVAVYCNVVDFSDNKSVEKIEAIFNSPNFIFNVMRIAIPDDVEDVRGYQWKWCLNHSRNVYPTLPVVIINSNSLSNISNIDVTQLINKEVASPDWDMFFLSKWLDRCDQHYEEERYKALSIVKTQAAQGLQAILFTPTGRDIILGIIPSRRGVTLTDDGDFGGTVRNACFFNHIICKTTVPNVFVFDPSTAIDNHDYLKLAECAIPPSVDHTEGKRTNMMPFLVAAVVGIIILLIFWFLLSKQQ